jgi:hypothetical protein
VQKKQPKVQSNQQEYSPSSNVIYLMVGYMGSFTIDIEKTLYGKFYHTLVQKTPYGYIYHTVFFKKTLGSFTIDIVKNTLW